MIRYLLLIPLLYSVGISQNINQQLEYFIDKKDLTIQEIKQSDKFKDIDNYNFGYQLTPIYTKMVLKNTSYKQNNYIIYNPRSTIDFLDVYIFKDKKLIKELKLGDMRPNNQQKEFQGKYAYFNLNLEPNIEYTIYTKLEGVGIISSQWIITSVSNFLKKYSFEFIVFSIYTGLMLFLIFQNTLHYLSIKSKIFNIYSLYIASMLLSQLSLHGYTQLFNSKIDPKFLSELPWFVSILTIVFAIYFFTEFFKLRRNNLTLYKLHLALIFINIISFIILLYSVLFQHELYILLINTIIDNFFTVDILATTLLAGFNVYIGYKNKIAGTVQFMLGFITLSAIMTFHVVVDAITPIQTNFSIPPSIFGATIEFIFISYALSLQIKDLYKKEKTSKKLLLEYSNLAKVGKSVGNMIHQWRAPIVNIGTMTTNLEATYKYAPEKLNANIENYINNINKITHNMNDTMFNLLGFYKQTNKKELLNIDKELNLIIDVFQYQINNENINITLNCDQNITIYINKNDLYNIFLVLFENSVNAFNKNNIINKLITINISQNKQEYVLKYKDNAGGFDTQELTNQSSTGIGLELLNDIVNNKMNGRIEIKSENKSSEFTIYSK